MDAFQGKQNRLLNGFCDVSTTTVAAAGARAAPANEKHTHTQNIHKTPISLNLNPQSFIHTETRKTQDPQTHGSIKKNEMK